VSESRFRSAAETAPGGPDRDVLLTQVGRTLGLQGKYDEALAVLDAIPSEGDPEVSVRSTLERGRVLRSSGSPEAARPLFHVAYAAASTAGFEHLAVDSLHMMAIVADPADQDVLNKRALDLASTSSDPRAGKWRGSLLNNMGWTAFERGDYEDALALFEDALATREAEGKTIDIQVARWCVARTLRALGRNEEALEIQQALAEEHRAAGTTDQYVDEELAALGAVPSQSSTTPEPGSG